MEKNNKQISSAKNMIYTYICYAVLICYFFVNKVLVLYGDSIRTRLYFYFILLLLLLLPSIPLFHIVFQREYKYEHMFFYMAFLWGTVFCFAQPGAIQADGHAHLGTTYECSNWLLGYDVEELTSDTEDYKYVYVRKEDLSEANLIHLNKNIYRDMAEGNWLNGENDGNLYPEKTFTYYSLGKTPDRLIRYLFSGFGMTLGRILNLGKIGLIYFAKMVNVFSFALIGWFCVKIIPYGKSQMITIAMIPMMVETYSSLHYDCLLIELSLLMYSLCLYMSEKKEPIRWYEYLSVAIVWLFLIPNKYVFALWGMFALLLVKKTNKREKKTIKGKILGVVVLGVLLVLVLKWFGPIILYFFKNTDGNTYDIGYQITHPLQVLQVYICNLKPSSMLSESLTLMGNQIGHFQGELSPGKLIMMYIFVVASVVMKEGQRMSVKKRIYCTVVCIITLFGVYTLCLTRYSRTYTSEMWVWGRYLMPVFMLFPLIYGTKQKEDKESLVFHYIQSLLLSMITCELIWMAVA